VRKIGESMIGGGRKENEKGNGQGDLQDGVKQVDDGNSLKKKPHKKNTPHKTGPPYWILR